jgi:hypothetical protein
MKMRRVLTRRIHSMSSFKPTAYQRFSVHDEETYGVRRKPRYTPLESTYHPAMASAALLEYGLGALTGACTRARNVERGDSALPGAHETVRRCRWLWRPKRRFSSLASTPSATATGRRSPA